MIGSMYQDDIDRSLDEQQRSPDPDLFSKPGIFTGFWRSAGGLLAAPLEAGAARADQAKGFGQVMAATGAISGGGMFSLPSDAERKQNTAAYNKLMTEGVDVSSAAGDAMRVKAKSFMPDPQSTGVAGQILGGLLDFGIQGAAAMAGGPGGLVGFGVDQALNESDKLKQQGVDLGTRSTAGAIKGLTDAASMILPVTGPTAAIRAVKGAAGGVSSAVAQSAAERFVLQHGGYDKISSQYDPFDPLTIAISALVPAGLGAALGHAVPAAKDRRTGDAPPELHATVESMESGGHRYAPDGSLLKSPAGAQGEMQVMSKTATDPGFGVKPAADNSPEELARVGHDYLDAMYRRYNGDQAKALAAYNAGPGSVDKAVAAHPDNWLAHLPTETRNYVAEGAKRHAEAAAVVANPDAIPAARVKQTADAIDSSRLTPDDDLPGHDQHIEALQTAADQIGRGAPVEVSDILSAPDLLADTALKGDDGLPLTLYHGTGETFDQFGDEASVQRMRNVFRDRKFKMDGRFFFSDNPELASEYAMEARVGGEGANVRPVNLHLRDPLIVDGKGARGDERMKLVEDSIDSAVDGGHDGVVLRNVFDHISEDPINQAKPGIVAIAFLRDQIRSTFDRPAELARAVEELRAARAARDGAADVFPAPDHAAPHDAVTQGAEHHAEAALSAPRAPVAEQAPTTHAQVTDAEPKVSQVEAAAADAIAANPDLMIQLEGMAEPMRAQDFLDSVREASEQESRDSSLIEVAARCSIGF